MHAEREALARDVLHYRLEVGELRHEGRPPVDHQEDVAERVGERRMVGIVPHLPVRGDRAHPVLLERRLSLPQDGLQLGDHAVDAVGLRAGGDATDVGQVFEVHQPAATEVDAVELHLPRRVGRGGRQQHRLQERRLAGLGRAADRDVAARGGDVDAPHLLAMPTRLVHDAEPEAQRLTAVALNELVDRYGIGQRRQPHSVGPDLTGGQLVRARPHAGRAVRVRRSCLDSRSLRSSLVPRCDPHSPSSSGAH